MLQAQHGLHKVVSKESEGNTLTPSLFDVTKIMPIDTLVKYQFKLALLVVFPPLIVFAAFRNLLILQLQQFWGASGDFWQGLWDGLIHKIGDDPFTLYVWGTVIISTIVYWAWGLIYTLMDVTLKPAFLRKYKVQPGTNEPADSGKLRKLLKVVILNQIVVNIPMAYFAFYLMRLRTFPRVHELPSFHVALINFVGFVLIHEVGFYYSHRLMHSKYLYRHIHKMHHEWTSPIGLAAAYAHPIEHALCNVGPLLAGPVVLGPHLATYWAWFILGILITINHHSGYHFPLLSSNEFHDFHHLKFTECFGVLGILDRLHKTDTLFGSSGVIKRHQMLKSLTPMRELYPLSDKTKVK